MGSLRFYVGDVLVEETEMEDAHLALATKRLAGDDAELVRRALCANVVAGLTVDQRWREIFGEASLAEAADMMRVEVQRDAPRSMAESLHRAFDAAQPHQRHSSLAREQAAETDDDKDND